METLKLTSAQKETIAKIEERGFKKDKKNSRFEKELDGTSFYAFHAQHGMGVEMIQLDGTSEGNLLR